MILNLFGRITVFLTDRQTDVAECLTASTIQTSGCSFIRVVIETEMK